MLIRILDNRKVEKQEEEGTQNENRIVTLNLEVPEDYSSFIKKIVFITEDGNFFDYIENDNTYILKNNITKYRKLKSYIWLTDSSTNKDFRSETFDLEFNDNENPSDYVPSEQEQSQFDLMVEQLEELIEEVEAIPTLSREIVEELPTEDIDPDTIYMVLREDTEPNNIYDEWMYINNAWEKIGSTQVDIKNITDQIEAIEKDLYGEVEKTSENGSITLNNSKEDRDIVIDKLYGETSQETTTGYQLFNIPDGTDETTGLTIAKQNGVITLNGTTTGSFVYELIANVGITTAGNCTVVRNGTDTSNNSVGLYLTIGTTEYNCTNQSSHYDYRTLTATGNVSTLRIRIASGVTLNNFVIKPLLYLGDYDSNKVWEKYTGGIASPNPSFPENINVVTGTQEVVVRGKNLFDYNISLEDCWQSAQNGAYLLKKYDNDYIKVTKQNNGYYVNSYNNSGYQWLAIPVSLPKNTNMKIVIGSTNISAGDSTNVRIYGYNSFVAGQTGTQVCGSYTQSFNTGNYDYYTFCFYPYQTGRYLNDIMIINENITDITYEPYITPTTYTLHLGNMELAGIEDYKDYIYFDVDEGKWYKKKVINKLTLNGTEDWAFNANNTVFVKRDIPLGIMLLDWQKPLILSNYYSSQPFGEMYEAHEDYGIAFGATNADRVCIRNKDITSVADFKNWLSSHNVIEYYPLATPTDEEIIDTTLIEELNSIYNLKQFDGTTIIEIDGIPQFHIIYDGNKIENMEDEIEGKLDDSDIATTITSSSTNAKVAGAKAVYDYVGNIVGNIDTLLDNINGEVI